MLKSVTQYFCENCDSFFPQDSLMNKVAEKFQKDFVNASLINKSITFLSGT